MKISDALQDPKNLNLGNASGAKSLDQSLTEVGFARPMVMSSDGVIIAGNQTQKSMIRLGMGELEPIIVETDGTRPIIHKRTDLQSGSEKAVKLAVYDNLANQRGLKWRADVREIIEEQGMTIEEAGFTEEEVKVIEMRMEVETPGPDRNRSGDGPQIGTSISVVVECRDEDHAQEIYERMQKEGLKCRVLSI